MQLKFPKCLETLINVIIPSQNYITILGIEYFKISIAPKASKYCDRGR